MNVLVVDDNREMRNRIVADLEQSGLFCQIQQAKDGIDGYKKVSAMCPELILCDVEMPRMDGFKFLGMIRSNPQTNHIPVVMLTGIDNRSARLRGLAEGAKDFLQIPYDPDELIARIKLHLKAKQFEDELRKRNKELELLSSKDPLTGAFNRRYLNQALSSELMRAKRSGGALSLIMLDIDHFKMINDTYGHPAGDLVLQQVTVQLDQGLREYDVLIRYGGEEFLAILPDAELQEAELIAERLRQKILLLSLSGELAQTKITASFGVTSTSLNRPKTAEELLAQVDSALYQAKQQGRNQVVACLSGQLQPGMPQEIK